MVSIPVYVRVGVMHQAGWHRRYMMRFLSRHILEKGYAGIFVFNVLGYNKMRCAASFCYRGNAESVFEVTLTTLKRMGASYDTGQDSGR